MSSVQARTKAELELRHPELQDNTEDFFYLLLKILRVNDVEDLTELLEQRGVWRTRARRLSAIFRILLEEGEYVQKLADSVEYDRDNGDELIAARGPDPKYTLASKIWRYKQYPYDER